MRCRQVIRRFYYHKREIIPDEQSSAPFSETKEKLVKRLIIGRKPPQYGLPNQTSKKFCDTALSQV